MAALNSATLNNSPTAVTTEGTENAQYVSVTHEGESYIFALAASGVNKNEAVLDLPSIGIHGAALVSDTGTMTLSKPLDGFALNPDLLKQPDRGGGVS